jgi:hypothetical protein
VKCMGSTCWKPPPQPSPPPTQHLQIWCLCPQPESQTSAQGKCKAPAPQSRVHHAILQTDCEKSLYMNCSSFLEPRDTPNSVLVTGTRLGQLALRCWHLRAGSVTVALNFKFDPCWICMFKFIEIKVNMYG